MNITRDVIDELDKVLSNIIENNKIGNYIISNEPILYDYINKMSKQMSTGFPQEMQDPIRFLVAHCMQTGFLANAIANSNKFMVENSIDTNNNNKASMYNEWLSGRMSDEHYIKPENIDVSELGGEWETAVKNHEQCKKDAVMNAAREKLIANMSNAPVNL